MGITCKNIASLSTMHSLGTTQSYLHAQICNDSHLFLKFQWMSTTKYDYFYLFIIL
jgi:hypothetical protein